MIKFPEEAFNRTQEHYLKRTINYLIDWKYRRTVTLKKWIETQIKNPTTAVQKYADNIKTGNTYDETIKNILIHTINQIKYVKDENKWSTPEYWATAHETLTTETTTENGTYYGPMQGDCEDGAVLIYVTARLKGIPSNRLLLLAGDVNGGGHCWLGYKPSFAPWLYAFIDWCYYPSIKSIDIRDHYFINSDNKISPENNKYFKVWFGFNEQNSYTNFKIRY